MGVVRLVAVMVVVCAGVQGGTCLPQTQREDNSPAESASASGGGILLNLDQIFLPTLPTVGENDDDPGLARLDLEVQTDSMDFPGVLTIASGSSWDEKILERGNLSSLEAPYGSWRSPITSSLASHPVNTVVEPPRVDPITGYVFWCEERGIQGRHDEQGSHGRHVAVFHYDPESGEVVRWTPPDYDVRTKVHEYGGGAFTVYNNTVFFSHGDDDAIYRQDGPHAAPSRLTKTRNRRYADGTYSPRWNALFFVLEDHKEVKTGQEKEPENGIVMIDATTGEEKVLISHADFFASPRVSQDGKKLVWVQWNHPQMPWDENRMFVAQLQHSPGEMAIAKFFQHGSMMMPTFDHNNELFYVHDSTGWWNLYRVTRRGFEINLTPETQEVGWPMWRLGRQAYHVNPRLGTNEAIVICGHDLTLVDLARQQRRVIKTGYSSYSLGVTFSKTGHQVYVVAGDGVRRARLVEVDVESGSTRDISGEAQAPVDVDYLSTSTLIQFPTTQADFAYGYLYMPKNPNYHAPMDSRPPLLVRVHGGPTGAASSVLNLEYQFYTSRGFAILDVDYRGSTGYGRLYRNKLNEMWGVYDVEDVLAGASHLVEQRLVDETRLGIHGSSVAAYTTLSALTIPGSLFTAGASYYGVSDPETLATNTSKFKRNYVEALIGNLDRHKDRYVTRSPLRNHQRLQVPVIFFYGSQDTVVPLAQAKGMHKLLKSKGLPTAFMLFPGETHGLATAENRAKALEAEFFFFSRVFNFTPSDVSSDVEIDNLDLWRNES